MKSPYLFAGLGVFLLLLLPTALAQESYTMRYEIVTSRGKQGEMEYTIESLDSGFRIVAVLISSSGESRKDAEILVSKTYEPILSRKWLPTPQGEALLTTRYSEKGIELELQAPRGTKKARLPHLSSLFDVETIPFLLGFFLKEGIAEAVLPIFIPVSGMPWKGRIQKITKDKDRLEVSLTLAGEIIKFRYRPDDFVLEEARFPQRGYTLLLKAVTPGEQSPK